MLIKNNMKISKRLWFTFVELMIIVSILWILWTIWFIAFWKYLTNARDGARVSQLHEISGGLKILSLNKTLPKPDEAISVNYGWGTTMLQWKTWKDLKEYTEFTNNMIDPKTELEYSYILYERGNKFQLAAFLESTKTIDKRVDLLPEATANYLSKYPYLVWKNLWLVVGLDDLDHTPIEQIPSFQTKKNIDLLNETAQFRVYFWNTDYVEWTGTDLSEYNPRANCKRIKQTTVIKKSWEFSIDPDGDWTSNMAYCDMEVDGWWWTYVTMLADKNTGNLFSETGPNSWNYIKNIKKNIMTQWKLSNVWLTNSQKDILVQCFSSDSDFDKYVKPLIIYNFSWADKWHLTKPTKWWTPFSSSVLNASWDWNKFILDSNYTNKESEFMTVSKKIVYGLNYGSLYIDSAPDIEKSSPAYGSVTKNVDLSSDTYCVSAIR